VSGRLRNATVVHVQETRNVSRKLIEKALHMRALGYYSEVKSTLLTQTIFEVDRARKSLSRTNRALDQSQNQLLQLVEQRTRSLQQSEARYRDLIENQAAMIASFLPDTTRTFVNLPYARFWGKSRDALIGERWIEVFPESERAAMLARLAACTPEHPVVELEHELKRPGQSVCWLHWQFIGSFDAQGKITHYQGIAVDITERKTMERELAGQREHMEELVVQRTGELTRANQRLQELDQLKSLFIASMSHELRTPLNSILGFSGILLQGLDGELNSQQTDHLGRVQRSARHLLHLITDVIDLSRIEAGQAAVHREAFQLESVVSEAVDSFRHIIKDKGLVLELEVVPQQLFSDRRRLLQCVLNYLSNAVKFTENGTITIRAVAEAGKLILQVQDTGIGIDQEDQARLFTQFSRIDSPQVRQIPGTGLGLYLTQKLVQEILQGEVWCSSKWGGGSTFTLRIPLDIGPEKDGKAT